MRIIGNTTALPQIKEIENINATLIYSTNGIPDNMCEQK
jgi:hypothetical protein